MASFDIYLPKLREHLGLPSTLTIDQERRLWSSFSQAIFYGDHKAIADLRMLQLESQEAQDEMTDTQPERATVEQERMRLEEALAQERERAEQLQEEAKQLQAELDAERSKGFWQRLFGR